MSTTTEAAATHVVSADGTRIAAFVSGTGPPLVVVHGTTSDHTTWRLALSMLERHVTVWAVDRRGRGASGDSPTYSLEREYADVTAVLDAAAAANGGAVDLLGHSFGGNVSFGAAAGSSNLRKLVLYEGWPVPDAALWGPALDVLGEVESLLARGERERMLELVFRDVVKMSEAEIAAIKEAPTWPARIAAAHTVPREIRAFAAQAFDTAVAATISVPVLLLVGGDSPDDVKADPEIVAAALPDARIGVLSGQMHMAHLTDPRSFVDAVIAFLRE